MFRTLHANEFNQNAVHSVCIPIKSFLFLEIYSYLITIIVVYYLRRTERSAI